MDDLVLESEVVASEFFDDIGYSTVWEDESVIDCMLDQSPGKTALSITSGGDFSLKLLLEGYRVLSIDFNQQQSFLLELKVSAIKSLSHAELWEFMGLQSDGDPLHLYAKVQHSLTPNAKRYWDKRPDLISKGVLFCGKQDMFFQKVGVFITRVQGRRLINDFFACQTLPAQKEFVATRWNNWRWRMLTKVLFSKAMMNKAFHKDHFKYAVDGQNTPEEIKNNVITSLSETHIKNNYYLHWLFFGTYKDQECCPAWLRKSNNSRLKQNVSNIEIKTSELEKLISSLDSNSISLFNFSNIFDWVSQEQFNGLIAQAIRCGEDGATLCYWNNIMIKPRQLRATQHADKRLDKIDSDSDALSRSCRTAGYSGCTVARISHSVG